MMDTYLIKEPPQFHSIGPFSSGCQPITAICGNSPTSVFVPPTMNPSLLDLTHFVLCTVRFSGLSDNVVTTFSSIINFLYSLHFSSLMRIAFGRGANSGSYGAAGGLYGGEVEVTITFGCVVVRRVDGVPYVWVVGLEFETGFCERGQQMIGK